MRSTLLVMQIVKIDVPVQTLFTSSVIRDSRRSNASASRPGRFTLHPHRHREMGVDGVYYFFVGYDADAREGGFCIVLRAHVLEEAFPRVRHARIKISWVSVYNLAMDSGAIESRIAPMHPPHRGVAPASPVA